MPEAPDPRQAGVIGGVSLLLRFLLELAMLAALAVWGFLAVDPVWLRFVLGLGAPMLALFVWGGFVAPRAPRRLADPWRLIVEIVLFGLATLGLLAIGATGWAIALGVIAAINIGTLQAMRLR